MQTKNQTTVQRHKITRGALPENASQPKGGRLNPPTILKTMFNFFKKNYTGEYCMMCRAKTYYIKKSKEITCKNGHRFLKAPKFKIRYGGYN